MIGEAGNRDIPLLNADDAFDDPDVEAGGVEQSTLLDMQLEVRGDVTLRALDAIELCRIAAEKSDAVGDRFAAAREIRELVGFQLSTDRPAAVQAALFVRPDRDLQRMACD